jgi:hypothetical protein
LADQDHAAARKGDDDWVRRAGQFLRARRRCPNEIARHRLADQVPDLAGAVQLHEQPDPFLQWEVEARLLAGETCDQIAAKCGLAAEAVAAYHALFFHVQDRLGASSYIIHTVLGPKIHDGLTEADVDVILKLFGYRGGPTCWTGSSGISVTRTRRPFSPVR